MSESAVPLFVGTCLYQTAEAATSASMVRLSLNVPKNVSTFGMAVLRGYGVCRNLDQLYDQALAAMPDDGVLIYHDHDISYDPEDVQALVAEHQRLVALGQNAIIGALYHHSTERNTVVGSIVRGAEWIRAEHSVEAQRLGFGFILIPLALIRQMKKPRAAEEWDGVELITQDTVFCERARAAGYPPRAMILQGVRHRCVYWRSMNE